MEAGLHFHPALTSTSSFHRATVSSKPNRSLGFVKKVRSQYMRGFVGSEFRVVDQVPSFQFLWGEMIRNMMVRICYSDKKSGKSIEKFAIASLNQAELDRNNSCDPAVGSIKLQMG